MHGDIKETLQRIDVSASGEVPLEVLRNYLHTDDLELNNTQLSVIYWCICKVRTSTVPENDVIGGGSTVIDGVDSVAPQESIDAEANLGVGEGNMDDSLTLLTRDELEVEVEESVIDPNTNEIATYFDGDVNTYLSEFAKDVTRFIDTMPTLDSNVILGTHSLT